MKKKVFLILLAMAAMLILTACGKFTCDLCGAEKSGRSYKREVLGEQIIICKDCYDEMRFLFGG